MDRSQTPYLPCVGGQEDGNSITLPQVMPVCAACIRGHPCGHIREEPVSLKTQMEIMSETHIFQKCQRTTAGVRMRRTHVDVRKAVCQEGMRSTHVDVIVHNLEGATELGTDVMTFVAKLHSAWSLACHGTDGSVEDLNNWNA